MKKLLLLCAWLCATVFVVAVSPARADNYYTFVSVTGDDSNACDSPAAACRTFVNAVNKTFPFGEIICVNGGFVGGEVFITQSVTIDCAGAVALSGGDININGSGIIVRLRNLSIDNIGNFGIGIQVQNAAALYIENCVITNSNNTGGFDPGTYVGIYFAPSANAQLFVTNSIISNNGDSSTSLSGGIEIVPAPGVKADVSISHSEISGNFFGIVGDGRSGGTIEATISDSVVSGSTENGVTAISSGSSVVFMIDQTKVTGNLAAGLFAGGSNAGMLARNTTVFKNAIGLDAAGGAALVSYGNNSVAGNTTNGAFTAAVSQE